MYELIRAYDNGNRAITDSGSKIVPEIYFNLVKLAPGQTFTLTTPNTELVAVVMSGTCTITVGGQVFSNVGVRADVWSGRADSVYLGTGREATFTAGDASVEIALAGAPTTADHAPFRIGPEDVQPVVVGSSDTKSRREICHILGQNATNRVERLLVSELYAEEGCWSGYPPHKHDEAREGETNHAELYHYRYAPVTGFGVQVYYQEGQPPRAEMIQNGDTFLIPEGYHPTAASPGHSAYVFTILVGRDQRGLVQHFDTRHEHLVERIPGIGAMRAAFKT
jgi:5-deoxy-glucuronate isomerase